MATTHPKAQQPTAHHKTELLQQLHTSLQQGGHWAIIGPGGSGKTTLLKDLAQHAKLRGVKASYVDVKHQFKNINSNSNFYYQQRYSSLLAADSKTVHRYLTEKLGRQDPAQGRTIHNVVQLFALAPLLQKHLIQLSNGETKRLRIAAALLGEPELLLLDNPFAGLDVATRAHFETILKAVAALGKAVVLSTTADQIPQIINRVVLLDTTGQATPMTKAAFGAQPTQTTNQADRLIDREALQQLFRPKHRKPFNYLVRMNGVDIRYGDHTIVCGIHWNIKLGEHWVLSGPNGSGKSSLLSLIYGDHPQAYTPKLMLFDKQRGSGESIWDIKARIGYMSPELFQYFPGKYTCLQAVESGFYDTIGVFRKVPDTHRKQALHLMQILGIGHLQNKRLAQVSATEQRLALLARAIVKLPYLLILDEPCQGFDKAQQSHFRQLVDLLAELTDMALVYVTHHEEQLPQCIHHRLQLG